MSIYPPVLDSMVRLLSVPRLSTYLHLTNDRRQAVDLYRWNLDVSMAFFEDIHFFEVALRNTVDRALERWCQNHYPAPDSWLKLTLTPPFLASPAEAVGLNNESLKRIREASKRATRRHRPAEPGHIVAELTLGFWQYVIATDPVWRNALSRGAFVPGTKKERLTPAIDRIRELRNRIAHHEPILSMDLEGEYSHIIETASFIDPNLGWWIDSVSRVDTVLRGRPIFQMESPTTEQTLRRGPKVAGLRKRRPCSNT